jgi:hypothetical protein
MTSHQKQFKRATLCGSIASSRCKTAIDLDVTCAGLVDLKSFCSADPVSPGSAALPFRGDRFVTSKAADLPKTQDCATRLKGAGYGGRYLQDGSVASLEEMFNPTRLKDTHVPGKFIPDRGIAAGGSGSHVPPRSQGRWEL